MINYSKGDKIFLSQNLEYLLDPSDSRQKELIHYKHNPGIIQEVVEKEGTLHYIVSFGASILVPYRFIDDKKTLEHMMQRFIPNYYIGCELQIVNLDRWGNKHHLYKTFVSSTDFGRVLYIIRQWEKDSLTSGIDPINQYSTNYANNSLALYVPTQVLDQPIETKKEELLKSYRIKTEKEFIDEYGKDWENVVTDWYYKSMHHLFGAEIYTSFADQVIESGKAQSCRNSFKQSNDSSFYVFYIYPNMITDKPFPKTDIKKPIDDVFKENEKSESEDQYRLKTKKEFIAEFGPNFYDCVTWSTIGSMDHLFGAEIYTDFAQTVIKKNGFFSYADDFKQVNERLHYHWFISPKAITNKPLPQNAEPEKTEPELKSTFKNIITDKVVLVDTQLRKSGKNKSIIF